MVTFAANSFAWRQDISTASSRARSNLKAAKALGLTISDKLFTAADEMIE